MTRVVIAKENTFLNSKLFLEEQAITAPEVLPVRVYPSMRDVGKAVVLERDDETGEVSFNILLFDEEICIPRTVYEEGDEPFITERRPSEIILEDYDVNVMATDYTTTQVGDFVTVLSIVLKEIMLVPTKAKPTLEESQNVS